MNIVLVNTYSIPVSLHGCTERIEWYPGREPARAVVKYRAYSGPVCQEHARDTLNVQRMVWSYPEKDERVLSGEVLNSEPPVTLSADIDHLPCYNTP